jgi:hypothetical protein
MWYKCYEPCCRNLIDLLVNSVGELDLAGSAHGIQGVVVSVK